MSVALRVPYRRLLRCFCLTRQFCFKLFFISGVLILLFSELQTFIEVPHRFSVSNNWKNATADIANDHNELVKPLIPGEKPEPIAEIVPPVLAEEEAFDPANYIVSGWPPERPRDTKLYINHDVLDCLILPKIDKVPGPHSVLITAQSGPDHLSNRMEVRQTWGSVCVKASWCKLIFSLGEAGNPKEQATLEQESAKFGDILQDSFEDSYNNLTLKTLHILRYFVHTGFPYLLKTDDDAFIGVINLRDAIRKDMLPHNKTIVGELQTHRKHPRPDNSSATTHFSVVYRPSKANLGKRHIKQWMMPKYMFAEDTYPAYIGGAGYVVEKSAASCLLQASKHIPIIFIEDVYVTGLCAQECNIVRFHHPGFDTLFKNYSYTFQKTDVLLHYMRGRMGKMHEEATKILNDTEVSQQQML